MNYKVIINIEASEYYCEYDETSACDYLRGEKLGFKGANCDLFNERVYERDGIHPRCSICLQLAKERKGKGR
jgi:hypothetical protein